jgi:acetyl-CoA C-acetyltransferase
MRPVYMLSGGITKFAKAHPAKDFRLMVKEALDAALEDLDGRLRVRDVDGSVISYFSDHFTRQLKAGAMVQDFVGLCPKPNIRIEGGGATGGLCFQAGVQAVASGRFDVCAVMGFETMSTVETWKGNDFIALASDTRFDYPLGGFYTGYYAMMAVRHMQEFGTTEEQMARVAVKNYANAAHNPFAQHRREVTLEEVMQSEMIAYPCRRMTTCVMSDGAAVCILASEEKARKFCDHPIRVAGIGCGSDTMRMADRPHGQVPLLPYEATEDYRDLKYPGVHSFRAGRMAAIEAYKNASIRDPRDDIQVWELHDAYASAELQQYEDVGLCKYGDSGRFIESGVPAIGGKNPVNPSGGLLACGHPVGATGLMQLVFCFWQCQQTIARHFGDPHCQVPNVKRAAAYSHAGTGTYVAISILEKP